MKTYIPKPEEIYDGARSQIVEMILAELVDDLPEPGTIIKRKLTPTGYWPCNELEAKEVERLLRIRGWQTAIWTRNVNQETAEREWWIQIENPITLACPVVA